MRIIGDVHQKYDGYLKIIEGCEASVQIGDMGFNYSPLNSVDPARHKFFPGNHDHFDKLYSDPPPHYIGRFGEITHGGANFFWIGGGRSIDWKYRFLGIDLFSTEELSADEMDECLAAYTAAKPALVLAHECPTSVVPNVSTYTHFGGELLVPSRTADFLETLLEIHRPDRFVFGHFHVNYVGELSGTEFTCLNELSYIDI